MWRGISRKEHHYMCRMEDKVMRCRFINHLIWYLLMLFMVLLVTIYNQSCNQDRLRGRLVSGRQENVLMSILDAIESGKAGDAKRMDLKRMAAGLERRRKALDHLYIFLYIGECMAAAGAYVWHCRRIYLREHRFRKSRLYVQDAVCVGKKEIYGRGGGCVTINLVTDGGKRLSDVKIPSPLDSGIECDTRLLLVTDWIEDDGKNLNRKEFIDAQYERELRVYPARADKDTAGKMPGL